MKASKENEYLVTLVDQGASVGPFQVRAPNESEALLKAMRMAFTSGRVTEFSINTRTVVTLMTPRTPRKEKKK